MKKEYDYIIIGAGQAGIQTIEKLRHLEENEKKSILLIDKDPDAYYYRAALKYMIKGKISEKQVQAKSENYFKKHKITYINTSVKKISPDTKSITISTVKDEKEIKYGKLLLALGGIPFIPPITGKELKGVFPLRSLKDTRDIINWVDNKEILKCVILGGGVLGCELAEALTVRGKNVDMITKDNILVPRMLDDQSSKIVSKLYTEHGVNIIYKNGVNKIIGDADGNVSGVELENGKTINCESVMICTGIRRDISLAIDAGLKTNRGIIVNSQLQTSDPSIYAAGDCVEIQEEGIESQFIELWGPSGDMGAISGENMAGSANKYAAGAIHAYTIFWDHNCHVIGNYSPKKPKEFMIRNWKEDGALSENYIKYIFKGKQLVGVLMLGEARDPIIIQKIISEEIPIPSGITIDDVMKREFDFEQILYSQ
jgi:NAD(P)H-nitrite reductase large subunit